MTHSTFKRARVTNYQRINDLQSCSDLTNETIGIPVAKGEQDGHWTSRIDKNGHPMA